MGNSYAPMHCTSESGPNHRSIYLDESEVRSSRQGHSNDANLRLVQQSYRT